MATMWCTQQQPTTPPQPPQAQPCSSSSSSSSSSPSSSSPPSLLPPSLLPSLQSANATDQSLRSANESTEQAAETEREILSSSAAESAAVASSAIPPLLPCFPPQAADLLTQPIAPAAAQATKSPPLAPSWDSQQNVQVNELAVGDSHPWLRYTPPPPPHRPSIKASAPSAVRRAAAGAASSQKASGGAVPSRKCDGVRPHCSRCVKDGRAFECVFLGQKSKVDPVLVEVHHRAMERAKIGGGRRKQAIGHADTFTQLWRVSAEKLSEILNQATLQADLGRLDPPSMTPGPAVLPPRPGSDSTEQDILIEAFFRRSINVVQLVHKLSYLTDRSGAPPFLQAAICAVGASDSTLRALPANVMIYYYEFARKQSVHWFDAPSIENLQALLILGELSFHLGKTVYGRMLFGFACRLAHVHTLELSPVEKEVRRRCWFLAHLYERYTAITTGRPQCFSQEITKVKSMCSDSLWLSMDPEAVKLFEPQPLGSPIDLAASAIDIKLAVIRLVINKSVAMASPATLERSFRDCQRRLDAWLASLPPHMSIDLEAMTVRMAEMARHSNHEMTTVRWHISAFASYHGARLFLTFRTFSLLLPTVLGHRMMGPPLGATDSPHHHRHAILARVVSETDLAELIQAFDAAWTSSVAISLLALTADRLNITFPTFACLSLFASASFLNLVETLLAFSPPLFPLPPRRRSHTPQQQQQQQQPHRSPAEERRAVATRLLAELSAYFHRRQDERPAFASVNSLLREAAAWGSPASATPAPAAPQPAPTPTSSLATSATTSSASLTTPTLDRSSISSSSFSLASTAPAPSTALDDAISAWASSPDLTSDYPAAAIVALHRLALVALSFVRSATAAPPTHSSSSFRPPPPAAAGAAPPAPPAVDDTDDVDAAAAADPEDWHRWDDLLADLLLAPDPAAAPAAPAAAAGSAADVHVQLPAESILPSLRFDD
ncbi:hypothetical protein DFJ73DRAFT_796588 [Zopfochytrium polystomum]|nr:hypothetical protein DFJ73DRAFT_796588 [Zopfochytrium polystomum]